MEDTSGCVHGNRGLRAPASPHLISEIRLLCELAGAVLPPNEKVRWADYMNDYAEIRKEIATTLPDNFHDYETRMWEPGGFQRDLPAKRREWHTDSGRAQFVTPEALDEDLDMPGVGHDVLRLMTLRSNDQFNTTIYGYDDRFRGVSGTREVIFMHCNDIVRLGFTPGAQVMLTTAIEPEVKRQVGPFEIIAYDIPEGCAAAYYPECNPLVPLWHHAERSKVPAAKSVPVRLSASPTHRG